MEKSRSASSARRSNKKTSPEGIGGSGSSRADVRPEVTERVARFADRERIFRGARRVLAAVSGGPDSVAMLLILLELRPRFGFDVVAVHFDHQLREGSRDDLEWVRGLCFTLEVPFFSGEGDVALAAAERGAGIEEAARLMRYRFLSFVAGKEAADTIATGHTADDQVETVLMRIVRGSGVRGIRGMLPVGDVPTGGGQRLARPLLDLHRTDTVAFCRAAGISPLHDPTNEDPRYIRNRIRHETLDALRAVNPDVDDALLGLAASAREVFDGVEKLSFTVQPVERLPIGVIFDAAKLAGLPGEALMLVVEREAAFFKREPDVNRTRVENLRSVLASGSGEVAFGDIVLEVSCGQARLGPPLLEGEPFESRVLNVPGVTLARPWRVTVSTEAMPVVAGAGYGRVDASALKGALRVRPLVPGDRILYHGIERKVSDLLVNEKVPAWERLGLIAIADSERVHAVIGASKELGADVGDSVLYVRVDQVSSGGREPGAAAHP
jgi:tRNA(Ile)-lysidine synthase